MCGTVCIVILIKLIVFTVALEVILVILGISALLLCCLFATIYFRVKLHIAQREIEIIKQERMNVQAIENNKMTTDSMVATNMAMRDTMGVLGVSTNIAHGTSAHADNINYK